MHLDVRVSSYFDEVFFSGSVLFGLRYPDPDLDQDPPLFTQNMEISFEDD